MNLKDKILFANYEGTISQNPQGSNSDGSATLQDLLFGDIFTIKKPIEKVKNILNTKSQSNLYSWHN